MARAGDTRLACDSLYQGAHEMRANAGFQHPAFKWRRAVRLQGEKTAPPCCVGRPACHFAEACAIRSAGLFPAHQFPVPGARRPLRSRLPAVGLVHLYYLETPKNG